MGKYKIIIKPKAKRDLLLIEKSGNRPMINKLEMILKELSIHPSTGTGNPEVLKYNLSGYWSRRLNKKDRLIYQIIEEPDRMIVIVSALGHY